MSNQVERRTARVSVGCTPSSKAKIAELAYSDGYTLSAYIRMLTNINFREYEKTRPRPNSQVVR